MLEPPPQALCSNTTHAANITVRIGLPLFMTITPLYFVANRMAATPPGNIHTAGANRAVAEA